MARGKESTFEDLISIAALLPWWAGIASALVAWIGFGMLIEAEATHVESGSALGSAANQLWIMIFTAARFLFPTTFVIGAAASFVGRRRRAGLLRKVRSNSNGHEIEELSWRDFELVVSEAFRVRGYQVSERGGSGPDGGIDIELRKNGERFLVQCKHWKVHNVGVSVVRELFGVMAAEGVDGGFVICSGTFTRDAKNFARGKSIELIGADGLARLFKEGAEAIPPKDRAAPNQHAATATMKCPTCGNSMVKRTARKGPSAGESFWGCGQFPKCRGTRPI